MEEGRVVEKKDLLSPHLALSEIACRDGTPYPSEWIQERAIPLAAEFERIRAAAGGTPIEILSGFRTRSWNRKVGGARLSQHVEGRALDLRPPRFWTPSSLFDLVRELIDVPSCHIRGLGLYPTFVHIDIRPRALPAIWTNGLRQKADLSQ
jgi:hypothetical protein